MRKLVTILPVLLLSACNGGPDHASEAPAEAYEPEYAAPEEPDSQIAYGHWEELEPSAGEAPDVYYRMEGTAGETRTGRAPASQPRAETPKPSFDDIMSQLTEASFGYVVPKKVNIDDTFDVLLTVSPVKSPEQILDELDEGQQFSGRVKISRILQAKLTTRDFDVNPITPERQAVAMLADTYWNWELKPKLAGPDKKIRITISAIVTVDGEKTERYVKTYDGVVYVDITRGQRFQRWWDENWQWAWGAILVPLGGLALAWRRRKKKQ